MRKRHMLVTSARRARRPAPRRWPRLRHESCDASRKPCRQYPQASAFTLLRSVTSNSLRLRTVNEGANEGCELRERGKLLAHCRQNLTCDANGIAILGVVGRGWVGNRMEHDVLKLDARAGSLAQDSDELLNHLCRRAMQTECIGMCLTQEIGGATSLDQVGS